MSSFEKNALYLFEQCIILPWSNEQLIYHTLLVFILNKKKKNKKKKKKKKHCHGVFMDFSSFVLLDAIKLSYHITSVK